MVNLAINFPGIPGIIGTGDEDILRQFHFRSLLSEFNLHLRRTGLNVRWLVGYFLYCFSLL